MLVAFPAPAKSRKEPQFRVKSSRHRALVSGALGSESITSPVKTKMVTAQVTFFLFLS